MSNVILRDVLVLEAEVEALKAENFRLRAELAQSEKRAVDDCTQQIVDLKQENARLHARVRELEDEVAVWQHEYDERK